MTKRPVYGVRSAFGSPPSRGGQLDEAQDALGEHGGRAVDGVGQHGDGEAIGGIPPRAGDEPREAPAVADDVPLADRADLEAEAVLAGPLDRPLGPLHLALGVVGQDALVAVEVGGGPAHEIGRGRGEPGGGRHRAGRDVVERDALRCVPEPVYPVA